MASYTATTTWASTGTAASTITPGFQATSVTVTVAPASGGPVAAVQYCHGWTDGTRKKCSYVYGDALGNFQSENNTSKLVQLWGLDGMGNMAILVEGVLNSITATQVKFDVSVANSNYQVSIKCES